MIVTNCCLRRCLQQVGQNLSSRLLCYLIAWNWLYHLQGPAEQCEQHSQELGRLHSGSRAHLPCGNQSNQWRGKPRPSLSLIVKRNLHPSRVDPSNKTSKILFQWILHKATLRNPFAGPGFPTSNFHLAVTTALLPLCLCHLIRLRITWPWMSKWLTPGPYLSAIRNVCQKALAMHLRTLHHVRSAGVSTEACACPNIELFCLCASVDL